MPIVAVSHDEFRALPEEDQRLVLAATRVIGLGQPVVYVDDKGDLWDLYSSLLLPLDDMTLLGSTAEITLPPNKFPFETADRIYGADQPYSKDFIWGALATSKKAPLKFQENVPDSGGDRVFDVFDANVKKATFIIAQSEVPAGWKPQGEPPKEMPALLDAQFGGDWSAVTKTGLESIPKADLQTIADELGLTVVGTGSGGNVLKDDLVDAIYAFAQEQV